MQLQRKKWYNRRDEAYGILCSSISRDLLFHLDSLTYSNEVWEKLEYIFGNTYDMRGYQIKNQFISLILGSFESLQLYFSKFKALVLQLKQCGPDYSVLVSTFHATKLIA